MTPNSSERLSKTLDSLGDMTPEEAESQVHELRSADPVLADQVSALWHRHLSNAGGLIATADYQADESSPKSESDETGSHVPDTAEQEIVDTSSTGKQLSTSAEKTVSDVQPTTLSGGRYQILEKLGSGTFGAVHKALDTRTRQTVAVKRMIRHEGSRALEFFKGEFRYLQGISHPNLVQLLELEADGSDWLIAMELVEGEELLSHVRPKGIQHERRMRAALLQLTEGVAALHRHRRLHRDLKPQNVRVTPEGRVVVLDFGLAAESGPDGELRYAERNSPGTVPYMAPEQLGNPPVSSTASDCYAIGVMLYELLTGRRPFTGSVSKIVRDKATHNPTLPDELCPGELGDLCVALLARRPEDRPDTREIFRRLGHTPALVADGVSDRETAPLLGRERDLAELSEAFQKSQQGEPVVVMVQGPSGIGKSALVGHFTDGLRSEGAVVLTGRCYEHESVPYKALDPVIDELARHLLSLPEKTVEGLAPGESGPMVKVFPVLEAVGPLRLAAAGAVLSLDPQEVRRQAFAGLRELLNSLSLRVPLVIHIDDLQWGDIDSAYLLSDLIRPPTAPGVLWILAHRSEDAGNASLATLEEALARAGAPVHRMAVHPLTEAETGELVVQLLGGESGDRTREIFQESQGNPYFVAELVQAIRSGEEATRGAGLTLDGLIRSRVLRLPAGARRLLEVVAVSGRPLSEVDAYRAAEGVSDARTAAAQLEASRLLRGVGASGELELETYHDRVREALLAGMEAGARRGHHERLARALEESGRADVEQLALHFEGAGQKEKSGGYYHQAGDQAARSVAFDQAAGFFRKALDLSNSGPQDRRALRLKLAEALSNAGRGAEAGPLYLELAEEDEKVRGDDFEMRLLATDQFLLGGDTDRGFGLLESLIRSVGLPYPRSRDEALQSLSNEQARLTERGLSYEERSPSSIPPEVLKQVDVCAIAGTRLSTSNVPLYLFFSTMYTRLALDSGDPTRIAPGLASAAFGISVAGGETLEIGEQIGAKAMQMANEVGDPLVQGVTCMYYGYAAWNRGDWREALARFEQSDTISKEGQVEQAVGQMKLRHGIMDCQMFIGEWLDISRNLPNWQEDARRRGDLMSQNTYLVHSYITALAANRPDDAEEHLRQAWELWPHPWNIIGTFWSHFARGEILLYRGEWQQAWDLIERSTESVNRDCLFRAIQVLNVFLVHLRARAAIAVAGTKPPSNGSSGERASFLRAAENDVQEIESANRPWTSALAKLVRASMLHLRGQLAESLVMLENAEHDLRAVDMEMHATAARWQRGQLIGDGGQPLVQSAEAFMTSQGVACPGRVVGMLAPGFPD